MRLQGIGFRLGVLGLLALLAAPASAGLGSYHEDERIGFKIRTPSGWETVPSLSEEKWVVGQYVADKNDFYTDPTEGWTYEFKPRMTMISFIDAVIEKTRKAEIKGDEDDPTVVVDLNHPYKDYEDYLRREYRGGGWFISQDDEGDVRGIPVRMLEIKVEKLANAPKRIVAWVYDLEDVKVAVQFEVLEDYYEKEKGDVYASLKSFKQIKRTKELVPQATGETGTIEFKPERKMTPEARAEQRAQNEEILRRKARESAPDGWDVLEIDPFLVLSHADKKYAKELCQHVEAVWKWLDDRFDYIGPGEYVTAPIIRICQDEEEYDALFRGATTESMLGSLLAGRNFEIVTYKDKNAGKMSWGLESVNRAMYRLWFSQRDGDLWNALPYWLDDGLPQVIGTARADGRKLEFQADQWELEALREAARTETLTSPKDLVLLTREEFYDNKTRSQQSAAFLRFLLDARDKKTRRVLDDYLINLKAVITEIEEKEKKDDKEEKAPETEEEEEARFKERKEAWQKKEKEILGSTFDRTFGGWKDRDWTRLGKLYAKSVD